MSATDSAAITVNDLQTQMREALKAGEKVRLGTIRMLLTDLKTTAVAKKMQPEELSSEEVMEVISRQLKRRVEAASEFDKAGREELADKERAEAEVLKAYMPEQMPQDAVRAEIESVIAAIGASGPGDMGKVMGAVMGKLKGKADGGLINRIVKETLAK